MAKRVPLMVGGEPFDPWFSAPLWLQARCVDHVLWALNHEHLDYLERYIAEKHRRDRDNSILFNSALGEQLPKWMVLAKNRDDILDAIVRMRER